MPILKTILMFPVRLVVILLLAMWLVLAAVGYAAGALVYLCAIYPFVLGMGGGESLRSAFMRTTLKGSK